MNSPSTPPQTDIERFEELNAMVVRLTGSDLMATLWWSSRNSAFGELTPAQKASESSAGRQQVAQYLQMHSGDFHGL